MLCNEPEILEYTESQLYNKKNDNVIFCERCNKYVNDFY